MPKTALSVKNLTVSFKTDNGLVRAVRGISFDVNKGETLCIAGESGSGKSVTSKAIMGILANNAIVDDGEIIYEGENLLEITESDYHRLRGHKIGMIFQDPLSSLNPIVKIGKQITEAMLLNNDKTTKMFDELILQDKMNYNNEVALMNSKIKKLSNEVNQANADLLESVKDGSKSDKKKAKATIKQNDKNLTKEIKKIKEAHKEAIALKAKALKASKVEAKKKVKVYKKEATLEHKETLKTLQNRYNSTKDANEKEVISKEIETEKENFKEMFKITKQQAKKRALEVMKEVGIPQPEKRFKQYPFEFSGGMRQRIVIAIALTANPEILICDEPTTALDVTIQAQILELINKLKRERNLSCIFITHDLGVVANMADRVAIMYAGQIVEYGNVEEIFYEPKHPYTWALLSSIPDVDSAERLEAIPGTPPNMIYPPKGDAFALRSRYAMNIDFKEQPPYFKVSDTHYAATWLLHESAPKVEMPKIVAERIRKATGGTR